MNIYILFFYENIYLSVKKSSETEFAPLRMIHVWLLSPQVTSHAN